MRQISGIAVKTAYGLPHLHWYVSSCVCQQLISDLHIISKC